MPMIISRKLVKRLCLLLGCLTPFFCQAQQACKLYPIIVTAGNSPEVGTHKDKELMKTVLAEIQQAVGNDRITVEQPIFIDDDVATQSYLESNVFNNLSCSANDVIWYYYSGHGQNYDTWPRSAGGNVNETWVHNQLKAKGARLTITLFDCCNWQEPEVPAPKSIRRKSQFYKFLFLESKGDIKIASCESTQFSFGSDATGSLFTNTFVDQLRSYSNWKEVLDKAKSETRDAASKMKNNDGSPCQQEPKYEESVSGIRVGVAPGPPISGHVMYTVKQGDSWESIVVKQQAYLRNVNKTLELTPQKLKSWNPTVRQLVSGVKLKINL
jgi:Caspase domain